MYNSSVVNVGSILFPKFRPERIYMEKFHKKTGLPKQYSHWQDVVDQMLINVDTDDAIYLMVDSSFVKANNTHRRAGLHIDGYWNEYSCGHSHRSSPMSCHSPQPRPSHHAHPQPRHSSSNGIDSIDDWSKAKLDTPEALILASNYTSSRGYVGDWDGVIGDGGSCEHIDTSNMKEVLLEKDNIYISNVGFLHESLPVFEDVERTLIRLNVKDWEYS